MDVANLVENVSGRSASVSMAKAFSSVGSIEEALDGAKCLPGRS
jgi:hypothetical protein